MSDIAQGNATIFIDWDGTLSGSRFWQQWRDSTDNALRERYAKLTQVLFVDNVAMVNDWMRGKLGAEYICDQLAVTLNMPSFEITQALQKSCEQMVIIEGALTKIAALRQLGNKVAIATDNMDTFSRWTVPMLNLEKAFDAILDSSQIGYLKNERDSHDASLFFGNIINGRTTVLIDDNPDLKNVRDFGMTLLPVGGKSLNDWLDYLLRTTNG